MSTEAHASDAAAPKRSRKPLILGATAFLLLGGGGGAYWWFAQPKAAATERAEPEPAEKPGIVSFDPFVVNLADHGGARYVRITLGLVVDGEEHAKELSENAVETMRIRSAILELLALQTADKLTTADGKAALKTAIGEAAAHHTKDLKISDVLFSEFIVQ